MTSQSKPLDFQISAWTTATTQAHDEAVRALAALAELARTDLDALHALGCLESRAGREIEQAVRAQREHPMPPSWATVGRMLTMTRQSARERFSTASTDPSEQ